MVLRCIPLKPCIKRWKGSWTHSSRRPHIPMITISSSINISKYWGKWFTVNWKLNCTTMNRGIAVTATCVDISLLHTESKAILHIVIPMWQTSKAFLKRFFDRANKLFSCRPFFTVNRVYTQVFHPVLYMFPDQ